MTIYDRTRNGRPINPGKALYEFWYSLLDNGIPKNYHGNNGSRTGRLAFGNMNGHGPWYLSFSHGDGNNPDDLERPEIHFGGSNFVLNRRGEFLVNHPHGWLQRDVISRNTFLQTGRVAGQYIWSVNTNMVDTWVSESELLDWQNPIHYVSEHAMGTHDWGDRPWLKLEWSDDFGWIIAYSRQRWAHGQAVGSASKFEAHDRLREKRYKRAEREHLIATGVIPRPSYRRPTEEEIEERREAAAQVLAAHLEVGMAAKTSPLRRTTEEVGLWEEQPGCR